MSADDSGEPPPPGFYLIEIATVLNTLGLQFYMDARFGAAAATLSTISTDWQTNQTQAMTDLNTLIGQINALMATHPTSTALANALDCAEQLAGVWSGNDYV